ncbi:MAG: hypothetical protein K2K94_06445 [Muribaculaceae bacterium]|nr:hypothetical protein [Muribaculaceae bacterium]
MTKSSFLFVIMGVGLTANAHNNIRLLDADDFSVSALSGVVPSAVSNNVLDAPSSAKPFTLTGDFELCFKWYDFSTGQMSQTWQTSMYESIARGDAADEFYIKNFMREWLNPDPSDRTFKVADIKAYYNDVACSFTIPGGQFLYKLDNEGEEIDMCLIAVTRNEFNKLAPDDNLDIVMTWDGNGFSLDPAGDVEGLLIGARVGDGYGGLGMAYGAAMYPWNATMIYLVAPDFETEAMPYTCNVWASVTDSGLSLANYADCGFTHTICFNIDKTTQTAVAYNPVLQTLIGLDGEEADLMASDLDDNGGFEWPDERLTGSLSVTGGATMMFQNRWAAVFLGSIVGIYTNVYTIIAFDVFASLTGIESVISDDSCSVPVEYYDLNGIRVESPEKGFYIVKQGSKIRKEIR